MLMLDSFIIDMSEPDWSSLPVEILVNIAESLEIFEDLIHFCLVCKSRQSVKAILGKKRLLFLLTRFPWVMLSGITETNYPEKEEYLYTPEEKQKDLEQIQGRNKRRFYSFAMSKTYEIELPATTSSCCRKLCYGVGFGWLLTLGYDLQINLVHPFTRQQISMPGMLSFKKQYNYVRYNPQDYVSGFISKAVMSSSNPEEEEEDCIVMVIYHLDRILAFARPGVDKVWTNLKVPSYKLFDDVIYYKGKGKFYAVDVYANLFVCDLNIDDHVNNGTPKATILAYNNAEAPPNGKMYLVESSSSSSGFLLLINRQYQDDYTFTAGFSIYKLVEEPCEALYGHCYPCQWTQLHTLGDDMSLFIGYNASVSLPCSSSESSCVKPNCIYFSDDKLGGCGSGLDTGIYDVESGQITPHFASNFKSPLWLL